jgi:hypothetical protein
MCRGKKVERIANGMMPAEISKQASRTGDWKWPGQAQGCGQPERQTGQCERQTLADDHPEDVGGLRAHGHADADLVRPRGDGVLDESVDTNGCHQERNRCKRDEDRSYERRDAEPELWRPPPGGITQCADSSAAQSTGSLG